MGSLVRRSVATIGLVALLLAAPIHAAFAAGGSGIATTRPLSDASFDVERTATITTTRPLSDGAFEVPAGAHEGESLVTRRPLSDAGFEPPATATRPQTREAAASGSSESAPILIWTTVALAVLAATMSAVALTRRRHSMHTA